MSSKHLKLRVSDQSVSYWPGMGQTSVVIALDFPTQKDFYIEEATATLSELFLTSIDQTLVFATDNSAKLEASEQNFLRCLFSLARNLLQESGVPAFDPEVILRVSRVTDRPKSVSVDFRAAIIDNMSRKHFAVVYYHALDFALNFTRVGAVAQELKLAADEISEKVVQPLRKTLSRGFSTKFVLKEAYNRRLPIIHLGRGTFQIGTGKYARLLNKSATDGDSAIGSAV